MPEMNELKIRIEDENEPNGLQVWWDFDKDGRLVRVSTMTAVPPADAAEDWVPENFPTPMPRFKRVHLQSRLVDPSSGLLRFLAIDREPVYVTV